MREYPINSNIYTGSIQTCPGIPKALGLIMNLHYIKSKWSYEIDVFYRGRHL